MRKKLLGIAVLLAFCLGIGVFSMLETRAVTSECVLMVEEARSLMLRGNFASALEAVKAGESRFAKAEGLLRLWETHADVDTAVLHFQSAKEAIGIGDQPLFWEHSTALLLSLIHLDHQDDLILDNIF